MDITQDPETRAWYGTSDNGDKVRLYRIPESNLGNFLTALTKLVKRAQKIGVEPPTYLIVKEEFLQVKRTVSRYNPDLGAEEEREENKVVKYVYIYLQHPRVQVEGFEFLAKLEHTEEGNILHVLPGQSIPSMYREAGPNCDHCHTSRRRNDTFVLVETATDQCRQIGRNCLADYLGRDAERYADMAELYANVSSLAEASEGGEGWGGGGRGYDLLSEYLAYVAEIIRLQGWMSAGRARYQDQPSTASEALRHLHPPFGSRKKDFLFSHPTEESKQEAEATIAWCEGLSDEEVQGSDYLHNLRVIARRGVVGEKQYGFAASMVAAYQREQVRLKVAANPTFSVWVGEVGQRQVFELTVQRVIEIESAWGVSKLHTMSDEEGNIFTWFCSGEPLQTGKTYFVKGTVKKHTVYKGVQQTQLSRCDEVVYRPYLCQVGTTTYTVEAEDEKDARKRLLSILNLQRLPKGSCITLQQPTAGQEVSRAPTAEDTHP